MVLTMQLRFDGVSRAGSRSQETYQKMQNEEAAKNKDQGLWNAIFHLLLFTTSLRPKDATFLAPQIENYDKFSLLLILNTSCEIEYSFVSQKKLQDTKYEVNKIFPKLKKLNINLANNNTIQKTIDILKVSSLLYSF